MNSILLFICIGIGLSMDAFSLAIVYGTSSINKKQAIFLSSLVGIFHFIMPYLGNIITLSIFKTFIINSDIVVGIIFLVLALEMLISLKKEDKKIFSFSVIMCLFFAITVSLDSFSVGIALALKNENIILSGIVFSFCSSAFTLLGLLIGKKLNSKFGDVANVIGALILIVLALKYIL